MGLADSIILGLVQGLTEFLPVSSSGHLAILKNRFGVATGDITFEVLVHFGTLVAVLIYFREKLLKITGGFLRSILRRPLDNDDRVYSRFGWYIIIGTLPAAVIGVLFDDYIEIAFDSPRWSAGMLIVTAAILISTRWAKDKGSALDIPKTLIIGFAQALAIMPGISRSGSTISAGLFSGMDKSEAAEFSFLLSIPAILGATVLKTPELISKAGQMGTLVEYAAGAITAGVIGYISIAFFLKIVKKGKFFYFGLYCAAVGILGIILL